MIKIGVLCWLVNLPTDLHGEFNGRVVEVVGVIAPDQYRIDGPWIRAEIIGPRYFEVVTRGRFLRPFSDPDSTNESRTDKPVEVTA